MLCKYNVTPLDRHTYVIEEKTPFSQVLCYLLCGETHAMLIDTGLPLGDMKKIVDSLTPLPVFVVNTHAHFDHIGSNFRFAACHYHEDDEEVFALHTDPDYLVKLAKGMLPGFVGFLAPAVKKFLQINTSGQYHYFSDGHVFHLGGRDVEAVHTPGHSKGSVCLWEAATGMLFTGDSLCEWGLLLGLEGSCPPATYLQSLQKIKALPFNTLLPGHHGWPVDPSYIEEYEACTRSILDGSAKINVVQKLKQATHGRILITLP